MEYRYTGYPGFRWRSTSQKVQGPRCPDTLKEALCKHVGDLVEVFTEETSSVCPSDRIGIVKCVSGGILVLVPREEPGRKVYFVLSRLLGFQVVCE